MQILRTANIVLTGLFFVAVASVSAGEDIFVDIDASDCEAADGSREFPFCSIQQAIDVAFAQDEGELKIAPGVYTEQLVLRPDVKLEAGQDGEVIVEFAPAPSDSPYIVTGAANANIEGITIRLSDSTVSPAVLLYIPGVRMEVEEVYLDGGANLGTTGILITGPGSSKSRIKQTTFIRLEVGLEAVDTAVRITRNLFTEILRDAIYVHAPETGTGPFELPEIGVVGELELSGFNQFRDVGGFVVDDDKRKAINPGDAFVLRNTTGQTVLAQLNDWDFFDSATIAARISTAPPGSKQVGGAGDPAVAAIFEPFIGKSVFPGSIFLRIKDANSTAAIAAASPSLFLGAADAGIAPDYDAASELYSFTFLTPDTYLVHADATGYVGQQLSVPVAPGAIEAREFLLEPLGTAPPAPVLSGTIPVSPSMDETPILQGTSLIATTVHVFVNAVEVTSGTSDAQGSFSISVGPLPLGSNEIWTTAENAVGIHSLPSEKLMYELIPSAAEGEGEGEGGPVANVGCPQVTAKAVTGMQRSGGDVFLMSIALLVLAAVDRFMMRA